MGSRFAARGTGLQHMSLLTALETICARALEQKASGVAGPGTHWGGNVDTATLTADPYGAPTT